ncbi:MAG: site-specific integrase, partial [Tyzzerella sp.]|nr:site-specific integrase [Tyzzerella sp.]
IEFTKHYPREKHNATILTKDEIRRLLFEMRSTNWFLETLLALFCGLRRGEILGLKFSDFDTENETVTICRQISEEYFFDENGKRIGQRPAEKPPKTENSYRTMRIPKVIFEELEIKRKKIIKDQENRRSVYHDHGYISCKDNGEPHTLPSFYGVLKRACNRAGVPQVSVHDLRHMYATILLEQGVSLVKISGLLGHASIHTTFKHYCHVMEDDRRITSYLNNTFKSRKADS